MLFKKKTKPPIGKNYIYTQSENYRGFKRVKISYYGYKEAEAGIAALSDADLTGAEIKLAVQDDRAIISVGPHIVGSIWPHSFDKFNIMRNGGIGKVRLEIRDGDPYLFYYIEK